MSGNQLVAVRDFVADKLPEIHKASSGVLDGDRFLRLFLNCLAKTPALLKCHPRTLYNACMEAAQVGLYLDGISGEAHLVPFKDTCQIVIGYQGWLKQVQWSDVVEAISSEIVYENDRIEVEHGMTPRLVHVPWFMNASNDGPGEVKGAYAVARFKSGYTEFKYMPIQQILKHRPRTIKRNDGPWDTDPAREWMYKKTTIRQLCKLLPKTTRMERAITLEELAERGENNIGIDAIDVNAVPITEDDAPTDLDTLAETLTANTETANAAPESPEVETPVETPAAPETKQGKGKAKPKELTRADFGIPETRTVAAIAALDDAVWDAVVTMNVKLGDFLEINGGQAYDDLDADELAALPKKIGLWYNAAKQGSLV